jgi:hypothetical protein
MSLSEAQISFVDDSTQYFIDEVIACQGEISILPKFVINLLDNSIALPEPVFSMISLGHIEAFKEMVDLLEMGLSDVYSETSELIA